MLNLNKVTLWACVWSPDEPLIERTFRAVRYCTTIADFGEVLFFCCVDPRIAKECGWKVVRIPPLNMASWNIFVNRAVPYHITTEYALSVHEDGFILDPSRWEDEFLKYDYIGAPWPNGVVGNQGFCLESRKMMQSKCLLPRSPQDDSIPSDNFVCITHRKALERKGIAFAPKAVAERFSTEMYGDDRPSFGFHGRNHSHRKYALGWKQIAAADAAD